MAELNKDADAQIAQSEKDYDQAQELLRGFQASGEIESLSKAAQLMVGVLGTLVLSFCSNFFFGGQEVHHWNKVVPTKHMFRLWSMFTYSFFRQLPWTRRMLPSPGIHTLCAQRTGGRLVIARDWKHGRSQLRAHHWYGSGFRVLRPALLLLSPSIHDQRGHSDFGSISLTPRCSFNNTIELTNEIQGLLDGYGSTMTDGAPLLDSTKALSTQLKAALTDIFQTFDQDKDGGLSPSELSEFVFKTNGSRPPAAFLTQMGIQFGKTAKGYLSLEGFFNFFLEQTLDDPIETRRDLEKHGWDGDRLVRMEVAKNA